MPLFVVMYTIVFGGMNAYVAYRLAAVFKLNLAMSLLLFCSFAFLSAGGILFRTDGSVLPNGLTDYIYFVSACWMSIIYYAFILTLLCDVLNFAQIKLGLDIFRFTAKSTAYIVMACVGISIAYGAYHASHPQIIKYDITINKPAKTDKMRIVLISDIHFGKIIADDMAQKLVEKINQQNPDVVIFAGDIIDSDLESVERKNSMRFFKNIKSNYGTYGIMGNHEYFSRSAKSVVTYLQNNGVNMLIDTALELPNGAILYGRDDYSRTAGQHSLKEKLSGYQGKPILVADHQPRRIEETKAAGTDLLMSGHTHKGQFIPNNLITSYIYELDYGYKKFGTLNMIVTSGAGSWGPPVRIGSDSEVVVIDISFKE